MNTKYIFHEDARKHRSKILIITILGYLGFISFVVYELAFFLIVVVPTCPKPCTNASTKNPLVLLVVVGLIIAILLTIYLRSIYTKYYIFISKDYLEFYTQGSENKYSITAFTSYEIVEAYRRFSVYRLAFSDGKAYYIFSFKPLEFQAVLNKLLEDNLKRQNDFISANILINEE